MNQPPPPGYPGYPPPQPPRAMDGIDLLVPTNPLAAVACWVGILGLFTCWGGVVLGPIALATGVISLERGAVTRETAYGRGSSLARSWIGIVTGAIGTLVGIAAVIFTIVSRHSP